MIDEFNITWITFGGHVELQKYRFLYFVILFTVYILIICCNSTIFCIIWIQKSLHEPMYIFIAALLCNSLLFSTNIYPKLLMDFLSDKQIISVSLCHLQGFIYYSLCGSEFLLLSVMAYDRYVSICKPLKYHTIMRKSTVSILLVLAWLVPTCQLVPSLFISNMFKICNFTLNGIFCNNAVSQIYCMSSKASYIIYGVFIAVNTVFLPLLFILFTYTKILIITFKSSINVRRKAAQTCSPHLLVLLSFSCLCSYDIVIARINIDFHKTARFIMTLQVVLYHPLLNPVIYGVKMKEISKYLKIIFFSSKT
ncbi:olfactory receptor 2AT4-like [Austrofundulus limnaeus]|uniref:Olfactory receptor n=1 Tax=Austrofundulus limnaeus TaxID=52670 RepID=A0A2I4CZK2_AUSLI|nr:PREDICTED: olfactory receptor 2AT4-like [Austrofundulus limnaeus]